MTLLNDCPECGKQLSKTRKYCACGWRLPQIKETYSNNRDCQYVSALGRCEEMGTISPQGMGGKWFCAAHWYVATVEKIKLDKSERKHDQNDA